MNNLFRCGLPVFFILTLISGCANYSPDTTYSSQGNTLKPKSPNLVVPPGLNVPSANSDYKMVSSNEVKPKYIISDISGMKIEQGGSERWLVLENKTVDSMWPIVLDFLSKNGLTVKYQNQNIGVIQTDWASRNNNVKQTDVRAIFEWVGWGSMYSMPSQYMFRILLWQNGKNVQMFVTDRQMIEVYPGCGHLLNSSRETSDKQITKWMPLPPNPQLELEFLTQFMAFTGVKPLQIKAIKQEVTAESTVALKRVTAQNGRVIINDQFDRAWWRTGLALERAGLGIADKNRTAGEYYVYSLQSQVDVPTDGFFSRVFGSSSGKTIQMPNAEYIIKLTPGAQNTILTMSPVKDSSDKDVQDKIKKYLDNLATQLY
ncbi:MAG: outer membrane protein assembly factor BamC [Neisseriaceae bacterium]